MFAELWFHDDVAARAWFEKYRWPSGPICPHCGSVKYYEPKKIGILRCGDASCRKDFSVMTGSVMHGSKVTLAKWARAFHLVATLKTFPSAKRLQDELECEYNTGWLVHHRLMEAAERGDLGGTLGQSMTEKT